MKLKIFTATGSAQILKLENDVNEWLSALAPRVDIAHTNTLTDQVTNSNTGGEERRIMVMVWTEEK